MPRGSRNLASHFGEPSSNRFCDQQSPSMRAITMPILTLLGADSVVFTYLFIQNSVLFTMDKGGSPKMTFKVESRMLFAHDCRTTFLSSDICGYCRSNNIRGCHSYCSGS